MPIEESTISPDLSKIETDGKVKEYYDKQKQLEDFIGKYSKVLTPTLIKKSANQVYGIIPTISDIVLNPFSGIEPLKNKSAITHKQAAILNFCYNMTKSIKDLTYIELLLYKYKTTIESLKNNQMLEAERRKYELLLKEAETDRQTRLDTIGQVYKITDKLITQGETGFENLVGFIDNLWGSEFNSIFGQLHVDTAKMTKNILDDVSAFRAKDNTQRFARGFPTFKMYFVEEDEYRLMAFDDFYSYSAVESFEFIDSQDMAAPVLVIRLSNVTEILTSNANWTEKMASKYQGTADEQQPKSFMLKPGVRILLKVGYNNNPDKLTPIFLGAATEVNFSGSTLEIVAQGDGAVLLEKIGFTEQGEHFGAAKGCRSLGDVALKVLDLVPGGKYIGARSVSSLTSGEYEQRANSHDRTLNNTIGYILNLSALQGQISLDNPRDRNMNLPISFDPSSPVFKFAKKLAVAVTKDILLSTPSVNTAKLVWETAVNKTNTFDWVVYKTTVWDTLKEVCLYSAPNTIVKVFPYNVEGNPFEEKEIRSTIYIGNKEGLYLSADNPDEEALDIMQEKISKMFFGNITLKNKLIGELSALTVLGSYLGGAFGRMEVKSKYWGTFGSDGGVFTQFLEAFAATEMEREVGWFRGLESKLGGFNETETDRMIEAHIQTIKSDNELSQLIPLILPSFSKVSGIVGTQKNTYDVIRRTLNSELLSIFHNELYQIARILVFNIEEYIEEKKIGGGVHSNYEKETVIVPTIKQFTGLIGYRLQSYVNSRGFAAKIAETQLFLTNNPNSASVPLLEILRLSNNIKKASDTHFITSLTDIISNNISLTLNDMYNTVVVHYKGGIRSEPTADQMKLNNTFTIYADDNIPEDKQRVYHYYGTNVDTNFVERTFSCGDFLPTASKSKITASSWNYNFSDLEKWATAMPPYYRVATNILLNVVSKMYGGELVLYGNPNIKTFDTIYMFDTSKDMYGPFEVDSVIHMFSTDTGFVTTVKPKAIVVPQNLNEVINSSYKNRIVAAAVGKTVLSAGLKLLPYLGAKLTRLSGDINKFNDEFVSGVAEEFAKKPERVSETVVDKNGNPIKLDAEVDQKLFKANKEKFGKYLNNTTTVIKGLYFGWVGISSIWEGLSFYSKTIDTMFGREGCNVIPLWHNGMPFTCGLDGALKDDAAIHFGNKLRVANTSLLSMYNQMRLEI